MTEAFSKIVAALALLCVVGCDYKGDGYRCRSAVAAMDGAARCLNDSECSSGDYRRNVIERFHDAQARVAEFCIHEVKR